MVKIRYRSRRGYVREAAAYTGWNEYQVVDGRRVIARYDTLKQALRRHPGAQVDASAQSEEPRVTKKRQPRAGSFWR